MPPTTATQDARSRLTTTRNSNTSTVRVREHVHAQLQQLASEMNLSIQDVIEEAVEAFRQQRMIEAHNRVYAELRSDPERWAAELQERQILNAALGDGLEDA